MSSFTEIAESMVREARELDAFVASQRLPPTSFDRYTLADLPKDLEHKRKTFIDSAQIAKQLALGPIGQLYEILFNFTDALSLRFICHHNLAAYVPDDGTISFADLAAASGLNEVIVRRFLQHGMHNNIFQERPAGFVRHSASSLLLKHDGGMRDTVGFLIDDIAPASYKVLQAHERWPSSEEPNETGFNVAEGTSDPFYIQLAKNPERSRRFGSGMRFMTQGDLYDIHHLINGYEWAPLDESAGVVVDVGGGHGSVSIALAQATSRMKFVVEDLPGTVEEGAKLLPPELHDRVTFKAHDFLTSQTVKNADVYFFRFILHNWSDKYASKILENLVPAMKPGSKVVIYEFLPTEVATTSWTQKQKRNLDMIQATGWNSLERTEPDWRRLFKSVDTRYKFLGTRTPEGSAVSLIEAEFRP